jgi:nicotinate-nucleotide adenylyltransferase
MASRTISQRASAELFEVLDSPDRELFFLIGADILPELGRWRQPERILRLARLAVVNRPGAPPPDLSRLERLSPGAGLRATLVEIPGVDIAARDIRERVRAGRPIRYLTPPKVERYILEHALYRAAPGAH